ncbi:DMT family transporter [Methylophilaceae bacterium]|jgi:drug/metabolite transporter (DMT)-like permease|nr:DMT family transporter [Methylophilaceae bacterium]
MPQVQNGVIWMIIATFFFAFMGMFVKLGSPYFSEIELVFYRSFISLIFIILIIVNKKISLKTNFKKLHFYRSFVGFLSLLAFFYAISHLPLSTAISLNYTSPLFVALLITFFLNKKPSFYVCCLLLIGFFGAFLILKPTLIGNSAFAGFIGLLSGFGAGLAYLFMAQLGKVNEPDTRVVFYFTLLSSICAGLLMLLEDTNSEIFQHWWLLLGLGASATIAQLALTKAYRVGNTLKNAGLSYLTILFSSILGLIVFSETLDILSLVGILLIIISGIVVSKK